MTAQAKRKSELHVRRVVRAALELDGWRLDLDCGHVERAPDHDKDGLPVMAPRHYRCSTCGSGES